MITTVKDAWNQAFSNALEILRWYGWRSFTAGLSAGIQILGKAECTNPGGSVKDRAAASIVVDAQRRGLLTGRPGPSGRNKRQHRHRLRHAGRRNGLSRDLCMPSNVSQERKRYLKAYGAKISGRTPPTDQTVQSAKRAR